MISKIVTGSARAPVTMMSALQLMFRSAWIPPATLAQQICQWMEQPSKAPLLQRSEELYSFLPAPLKDLFPTLPPTEDVPAWDKQSIKNSAGDTEDAFFFVLVDGPADSVTNVNKRDGWHIEFFTGGVYHGQAGKTAHSVCLDDSADSNCDDMHLHGPEGKVL